MIQRIALLSLIAGLVSAPQAGAVLNEFSPADGYNSPFATRVWTYNPLWTFDGGSLNNNYVAQHGYNSGFAFGEPFALVVRNDNAAGNYRFHYDFEAADLAGWNPASLGSNILSLTFDVCSTVAQNSGTDNGATMMSMGFGGTAASPGLTLGFSDSNNLLWSDGTGALNEFNGYTLNGGGWDRITLKMNFGADTYDLTIDQMTGDGINGSATYTPINTFNVVTGMSFTNPMSAMENLWFETFTDPEDGGGWHKMFLDNFDSMRMNNTVPEPDGGVLVVAASACLAVVIGRRRRNGRVGSSD